MTYKDNKVIAEFMGFINTNPDDPDFDIYVKDGEYMGSMM